MGKTRNPDFNTKSNTTNQSSASSLVSSSTSRVKSPSRTSTPSKVLNPDLKHIGLTPVVSGVKPAVIRSSHSPFTSVNSSSCGEGIAQEQQKTIIPNLAVHVTISSTLVSGIIKYSLLKSIGPIAVDR